MVSQSAERPGLVVIHASGLVSSRGWSSPRLVPIEPNEATDTLSLNFVATSPRRDTPRGEPQPIEALIEISDLAPEIQLLRVFGVSNELTTPVGSSP